MAHATTSTKAGKTDSGGGIDRRLAGACAAVVLGTVMSILDATIVNVATRTLGQDLNASIGTIQWVLTGYLLGFAGVIPLTGWAADRFGAKRVWIAALALFLAGSALAAAAWSVEWLIAFRVVQGVGGGLIVPVGQGILARAAGPERMGRVMGFIGLPLLLGSVAGPVIGGVILASASWRWIFLINLPVGAAAIVLARRLLPGSAPRPGTGLDLRGLVLLCAGVTAFAYGMSEAGGPDGFAAPRTAAFLAAGTALVLLYVPHARARGSRALIDIALFRDRGFAAAAATNFAVAVALFGVLVLLPLYWQVVRGHGALATGLLLAPQALGAAAAMPLAGRLTDRFGAGLVVPAGIVLGLLGTAVYTQVEAGTPTAVLAAALFVIGLGLGATIMPSMAAGYRTLPPHAIGAATSALNTVQRLGASIGTAVLAVTLQHGITERVPGVGARALGPLPAPVRARVAAPLADAFGAAFWLALALGAVALVPALLLPRAGRRAGTASGTPGTPGSAA